MSRCREYVKTLSLVSWRMGEAKGYSRYVRRRDDRSARMESENLEAALRLFNGFKDIVPEHMIESFEKAVEKRNYDEMAIILETVTLYVALFCRGKLKPET